jgi:Ca2+-binding RTX toxin-like protein
VNSDRARPTLLWATLLACALTPPAAASAAEIKPTTTLDLVLADGLCSLREATIAANTDAAVDACPAGQGADTVTLGEGNYRLSPLALGEPEDALTGDLDLNAPFTLRGVPGKSTISGSGDDRVLDIRDGPFELDGLRVTGGDVTGTTDFIESSGGGIFVRTSHNATAEESVIRQTTIEGNSAGWGGGLATHPFPYDNPTFPLADRILIERSALLDNSAVNDGGGALATASHLTFSSSTLDGNEAGARGGAAASNIGYLQFSGATVSSNRAGESAGGIFAAPGSASTTIIAGNEAPVSPDCAQLTSSGAILVGDSEGCVFNAGPGDMLDVDPQLLPRDATLGSTAVRPITGTSPANDAIPFPSGGLGCEPVDQLGNGRGDIELGIACDVGAFEYVTCGEEAPTITGTAGDDRVVGTPGPDVIATFGGNDTVIAAGGDDLICTAAGRDRVQAGKGADFPRAGLEEDVVIGGDGDDRLQSGDGADRSTGGGGDDRLLGTLGRDQIEGEGGDDKVLGGPQLDRCSGGGGENRIRGCERRLR